jgi:hypothetical protein
VEKGELVRHGSESWCGGNLLLTYAKHKQTDIIRPHHRLTQFSAAFYAFSST